MHRYAPRVFVGFILIAILVLVDFGPAAATDESSTLPPEPSVVSDK
jgi:hypothetical protein